MSPGFDPASFGILKPFLKCCQTLDNQMLVFVSFVNSRDEDYHRSLSSRWLGRALFYGPLEAAPASVAALLCKISGWLLVDAMVLVRLPD